MPRKRAAEAAVTVLITDRKVSSSDLAHAAQVCRRRSTVALWTTWNDAEPHESYVYHPPG